MSHGLMGFATTVDAALAGYTSQPITGTLRVSGGDRIF